MPDLSDTNPADCSAEGFPSLGHHLLRGLLQCVGKILPYLVDVELDIPLALAEPFSQNTPQNLSI